MASIERCRDADTTGVRMPTLVRLRQGVCGEKGRAVHLVSLPRNAETHRDSTAPPPALSAGTYRAWGWPVTVRGNQVLLTLGFEVIALVLPAGLAEAVTAVLVGRDRPAPVLIAPGAPDDWVLLAGEPFGVPLPWPATVRLLTGTLPLPPSATPGGPVRWRHRPSTADLAGCREIDVLSAVRTALWAAEHAQGGSG